MLTYFICGFAVAAFALPLADALCGLVLTYAESLKSKLNITIARNNLTIDTLTDKTPQCAIGFVAPNEEEYEDE